MNQPIRRFSVIPTLLLLFLAFDLTAAAQYPPPPPPYPPPGYPPPSQGPNYPPPPPPQSRYPRNYPRNRPDFYNAAYLSLYGMVSAGHYSGIGVGVGTAPNSSGGITALGGTFGGYILYPTPGAIQIGGDARLIVENSSNSTPFGNKILGGLVGIRIDGSGAPLPIVPYFQFEIGGVGTNNGTSRTRDGSFAYQAQFGADFPVTQQLSARVEYGTGQLTGTSTNHTLQTFSAGLVLHIR
jgi:opacity protein-like surface antigen